MSIDVKQLLEDVKINHRKLNGCARHLFDGAEYKPGKRMTCLKCGGEMQTTKIGFYIAGYEAHGGDADDIWPGYRKAKT